jgi:DNA-binding IclR family transcriptional regulator
MESLNPTLWRTCKMLAGQKRIQLLRQLNAQPGQNVADLGKAVDVKRSDASQELRRIQSRGLLKSQRMGRPLIYRMEADPQVSSAAPLLKAIRTALASYPPERDPEMCIIANGLAHEHRIGLARALLAGPRTMADMHAGLSLSAFGLAQHVQTLVESGFATRKSHLIYFRVPPHPLARALAKLLHQTR